MNNYPQRVRDTLNTCYDLVGHDEIFNQDKAEKALADLITEAQTEELERLATLYQQTHVVHEPLYLHRAPTSDPLPEIIDRIIQLKPKTGDQ